MNNYGSFSIIVFFQTFYIHVFVFWVMTQYGLIGGYKFLGGEHKVSIFRIKEGSSMFLQNTDIDLPDYIVSYIRSPLLLKPQILMLCSIQ